MPTIHRMNELAELPVCRSVKWPPITPNFRIAKAKWHKLYVLKNTPGCPGWTMMGGLSSRGVWWRSWPCSKALKRHFRLDLFPILMDHFSRLDFLYENQTVFWGEGENLSYVLTPCTSSLAQRLLLGLTVIRQCLGRCSLNLHISFDRPVKLPFTNSCILNYRGKVQDKWLFLLCPRSKPEWEVT